MSEMSGRGLAQALWPNLSGLARSGTIAALATTLLASTALADVVTLTSRDGQSRISGDLVEADRETIVINTAIGVMTFRTNQVICEGAACPGNDVATDADDDDDDNRVADADDDDDDDDDDDAYEYTLRISASAGIADQLLPVIAEGIAIEEYDANARAVDSAGQPLPEDIGRPLPGGPREDDDDDDQDRADGDDDDDDEESDLISILFEDEDEGEITHAYAVIIEEEEDAAENLAEGEVEIIFLDEPAEDELVEEVARGGGGTITDQGQERVIAVEGVVIAVAPGNPIEKLNIDQIPEIFSGEITNWSEVGGADAPINVYSFDEGNAAFHYIEEMILEPADEELSEDATIVQTMRELTSKVAADPNGIGVVPYTNQRGTRAVPVEGTCGIITAASPFTIKNEEYLLNRRFYAYNRAQVSDEALSFLRFLDSEQIDNLVQKAGFIDLSVIEQGQTEAGTKMQETIRSTQDEYELGILRTFLVEMMSSIRLSTTFRFALGSSALDTRARSDVQRVADYISAAQPTEVVFVGFTDSIGSFEANANLSEGRAASVLRAVTAELPGQVRDGIRFSSLGYGELSPVACNDEADGRRINRRVEVWVR